MDLLGTFICLRVVGDWAKEVKTLTLAQFAHGKLALVQLFVGT